MRRPTKASRSAGPAIVAALVGLAFVLRMVFVPLHLARNDHLLPGAPGAHRHSHGSHGHGDGGHRHDERRSEPDDPPSDHEPHPVADHLDPLAEPATAPSGGYAGLALAARALALLPPDAPGFPARAEPESFPRPPPARDAAPPRAPPIVA